MQSLRLLDRRAGYGLASIGLLIGMVVPSVFPAFASAAQLNSRSITMSSSTVGATGTDYQVSFTAATAFRQVVIDFCSETPLAGEACTLPTGMSITGATVAWTGGTNTNAPGTPGTPSISGTHISITGDDDAAAAATQFTLSGIKNPTTAGTFYARIYTYVASPTTPYTNATTLGTYADNGGIALSATTDIGVSAAVRETLTFCVGSGGTVPADLDANCADANDPDRVPSITLGHGTPAALDSTQTDTADIYTQISTNAAYGAVVMMKNNTTGCGGLKLVGGTACIAPANTPNAITAGTALFGVKLAAPTIGGTGTVNRVSDYSTNYAMHYDSGNTTGVTSPYGDKIYDTNDLPVNNGNVKMTFGASIDNSTAAGLYKASINLVAAGTF